MTTIPILDLSGPPEATARALGAACRGAGFFLVRNHGVSGALMGRVFDETDAFFALPDAHKKPLSILRNRHNRGWTAEGDESLDDTSGQSDRKEAFNIGLDLAADDPRVLAGEPFRGINVWPEGLPFFRPVMLDYFDAVWALGLRIMRLIAIDLKLPEDFFDKHFDAPLASLRLLSYPPATGAASEIGAGAHTDYGAITLLATDGVPGLQVRPRGGDWLDVPHVPGAFVVNIADCLMRWTGDLYTSTPHRVLPPQRARKSVAFFLDPNPDSVIAVLPGTGSAEYPPVTGADYLRSRLDATYIPRKRRMTRRLDWAEYRAAEIAAMDLDRTIAILPTAAIEQHGPHLPVGTDTQIATGMLAAFRAACPADLDPLILPVQAVGKSNEHLWASGTLSLSAATTLAAWTEIGQSVARAGLRKIVIVNSHGGNLDLVSILSRELRVQAGMLAVKCQWGSFGVPEGLIDAREAAYGIHGGDVETSLMLDFAPHCVDMGAARDFQSSAEDGGIPPIGPVSYGWVARDLGPEGVVGDASKASAEKGRAIAAHQVAGFIALLRQVRDTAAPAGPADRPG